MPFRIAFLPLFLLLLTACGFHLKGVETSAHPTDIQLISTDADRMDFNRLKETIKNNRINITDTAEWKAVISDYESARHIIVTGNNGNSREIELIDGYHITLFHNNQNIQSTRISNRTYLSYNSSEYLGNTAEESSAHEQIAQDNADASLRFILATINHHTPNKP